MRKGFYQTKSKLYRSAKESVDTALRYAFVGRRRKKRDFRRLWVVRINAAARLNGLTYGQLIAGLKGSRATRSTARASPNWRSPVPPRLHAWPRSPLTRSRRPNPPQARGPNVRVGPVQLPTSNSQTPKELELGVGNWELGVDVGAILPRMSDSQIDDLRRQFDQDLTAASTESELRAVRDRYLVAKGRAGLGPAEVARHGSSRTNARGSAGSPTSSARTSRSG